MSKSRKQQKLKSQESFGDQLAEVRAPVGTIELALGCIAYDSTPQDAEDVRGVALMTVQRLRKLEKELLLLEEGPAND